MEETRPIDAETARSAETALLGVIAELLEAASDQCVAEDALQRTPELTALCDDTSRLASALGVIARRRAP